MYELAKKAREGMKAKARRLASETVGKVDSSTWSPAPLLRADIKTGARPIMKPSKKGIGESNAARDTKAAIGNPTRGAFKQGGAVKKDGGILDKKAVGAVEVLSKRGAAQNYKKGGRIKREEGGPLPSPYEAMESEARRKTIKVERPADRKLPSAKEAAASAARVGDVPEGRKYGGKSKKVAKKKGGSVGLTVVIAGKDSKAAAPQGMAAPIAPRAVPVPPPAPAPMPAAPPPAAMQPAPMGRKAGGRITKVAKSYKDMEAGSGSGEGRLQKTDIAKKRKGAPTS